MPRHLSMLLCLCLALLSQIAKADYFSPGQLRADFEELRSTLYASHVDPFAERSKEELDAAFDRMLAEIREPMSKGEAALHFQRWVALGDVAHARIEDASLLYVAHLEADGLLAPFDIRIVDGQMFVADYYPGAESLRLGDRIVAINDQEAGALRDRLYGELSADNAYLAGTLLEFQFTRVLWQVLGAPAHYRVRIERDGAEQDLELTAVRPSDIRSLSGDDHLQLSWMARESSMASCDTAYLRPGPFYNPEGDMWDPTEFRSFIDEAFAQFQGENAQRLVIDLRNNPGGNSSFSDHMLAWFADRPFQFYSSFQVRNSAAARASNALRVPTAETGSISLAYVEAFEQHPDGSLFDFHIDDAQPRTGDQFEGEVFVLINRHSYSNAVTVAAMTQDYGFGTILGEPTSDLATTLGAMEQFKLSETGISVGFPKARIVRPNGDLERVGVTPDHLITTPLVESVDDPVLARAMALACTSGRRG
ncbi:MAG: S41 family peptidase [Pseudomonadota bacterium]